MKLKLYLKEGFYEFHHRLLNNAAKGLTMCMSQRAILEILAGMYYFRNVLQLKKKILLPLVYRENSAKRRA